MRRTVLATMLLALPAASAAASWDGAAWADYGAFLSPLTPPVKAHLHAVQAVGDSLGRVPGRMGQIGDSITESSAYFRNVLLDGIASNETGHDYGPVRSWLAYAGQQPADPSSFYRDHGKGTAWGNLGGWELGDAVAAGHPAAAVDTGSGGTPGQFSWALLMFGTNDIDDFAWDAVTWKADYAAFVQDFLDLGVIPVLSTIPPEAAHTGDGRVEAANAAVRSLAADLLVPYVDYHALILAYQPVTWHGTLIGPDGTHPSAAGGGRLFSQTGLTTTDGYAARTKLTLDAAEKLRAIVFEDGPPETTSTPPAVPPGQALRTLAAAPNPFRERTTLRWPEADAGVPLRIVDARGALVRELGRGVRTGSERSAEWDGRHGSGRAAPAGVYFAVLAADGGTRIQKLVRLR